MSSDKATPFSQIPNEVLDMIAESICDPKDYLHLSTTCKTLWNKLDPEKQCLIKDVRAHRQWWEKTHKSPGPVPAHGYRSMLRWCIVTRQSPAVTRGILEVNIELFPEVIQGVGYAASRAGDIELLKTLYEMGQGRAVEQVADPLEDAINHGQAEFVLWLVENGAVVGIRHCGSSILRFGHDSVVFSTLRDKMFGSQH
ncbi:hypothetical protein F4779DRAFT_639925 [Xylariaceae sp. FL0662B]|nr:hypothetical protein F4779DRAFT_639925 [Xylariaceae sp. FL0662B]